MSSRRNRQDSVSSQEVYGLATAVDYFDVDYYGRGHRSKRELREGKRSDGTDTFHRYATLCVLKRGERCTLALTYVYKDDSHARVVKRLLRRARARGLKIRYL